MNGGRSTSSFSPSPGPMRRHKPRFFITILPIRLLRIPVYEKPLYSSLSQFRAFYSHIFLSGKTGSSLIINHIMLYKTGVFLTLISYTFVFDLLPAVLPGSGDALLFSGRRQDMENGFFRIQSDPGILSAVFLADERRQLDSDPALWLLTSPVVFPCWISVLSQDS